MSDETRPLAGLPAANRTLLARAPLELAVVEVRFAAPVNDVDPDAGLRIYTRLGELGHPFARLERAQEGRVSIQIQPGAQPESQVEQVAAGWQLWTADGSAQATVMPGAVVLQTSRYERWSVSLRPALEALLTVTGEVLEPAVVSRLGLRYIDRFVEPGARTPAAWEGRIHPSLLGAVTHPVFGEHVRGAQQQVELSFDDVHGALLRHGPFVDPAAGGAVSYLVDIDVFDLTPARFVAAELVEGAEVLNRTAASLFQAAVTDEYLRVLQRPAGEEVAM